jgi:hypothetical protein
MSECDTLQKYEITVKKVENKTALSKETLECLRLKVCPGSQGKVHCHTAKPEPNRRVTIDLPLVSF